MVIVVVVGVVVIVVVFLVEKCCLERNYNRSPLSAFSLMKMEEKKRPRMTRRHISNTPL